MIDTGWRELKAAEDAARATARRSAHAARIAAENGARKAHAIAMHNSYLVDLPDAIAEMVYTYAWQEGHSSGYEAVEAYYGDLADLVNAAYRAGGNA